MRFSREAMLLGEDAVALLAQKHVAVFGLGGVGGSAAEALARAGVGTLTLVDEDVYSESNINRQAGAATSTVGKSKAEVEAARVRDINPDIRAVPVARRYSAETRESFAFDEFDYILDAIDIVSCKLDLIQTALSRGVPIISSLGTGNKLDPSQLRVTDISKTENCPLARVIRKELRYRGIKHLKVVFSPEEPLTPAKGEEPPPGRRSVPGSVSWVPPAAGLMAAGAVVLDLIGYTEKKIEKE
ncbi:MAG: tRNA threonylcarbamoyladenosine dehydratase [Oscillospiraceae bacterium]|nr:tRNA threonylcarbamoyladenosine dehydratase [Oscillospiraceae bacterium]